MPRCWISLGSNLKREMALRSGVRALRIAFGTLQVSPVYESEAVGGGPAFFNLVVGIDTTASVAHIEAQLRAIEAAHGRMRSADKCAPRTLDLDLLTYGMAVGNIAGRLLPRDDILHYAFVLGPLAAVAPDERHPLLARTYAELWATFDPAAKAGLRPVALDWEASHD